MMHSEDPNRQYVPEMETQETLKRERTRILSRPAISSYRRINYRDITDIKPLKKGGFGEIHVAEWSRLRVVLKRALTDHGEGEEQFAQEVSPLLLALMGMCLKVDLCLVTLYVFFLTQL